MKSVLVEWIDSSFNTAGWQCKEHANEITSNTCVSLGVITKETDGELYLQPNLSGDSVSQGIVIPKGTIKRIRSLKVK